MSYTIQLCVWYDLGGGNTGWFQPGPDFEPFVAGPGAGPVWLPADMAVRAIESRPAVARLQAVHPHPLVIRGRMTVEDENTMREIQRALIQGGIQHRVYDADGQTVEDPGVPALPANDRPGSLAWTREHQAEYRANAAAKLPQLRAELAAAEDALARARAVECRDPDKDPDRIAAMGKVSRARQRLQKFAGRAAGQS